MDYKCYLPKYLSPTTGEKLFKDISMFPDNIDNRLYTNIHEDNCFQGDGIKQLPVIFLPENEIKHAPVLILSNTCDISALNRRYLPPFVLYTPLIPLENYIAMLRDAKICSEKISTHTTEIKRQAVSQIFYLPPHGKLIESIVFFDRIVSNHAASLPSPIHQSRLFSLSQYGHYLLLFKLSMHFTRLAESFDREY
ncbi:hypothetical protein LGV61_00225 [Desulfurispirillum indicum]|uniref:hypothetical protein n=1 Tax=Desulfurispirillum indicum TaxID=936456 RepID=UPI001CFAC7CC|nr:hypothetical protein [Desulfurispirillum indicum]UCZ56738.1 hypothetical protein LGV61_00225 [Desulfurispirillum indicum]